MNGKHGMLIDNPANIFLLWHWLRQGPGSWGEEPNPGGQCSCIQSLLDGGREGEGAWGEVRGGNFLIFFCVGVSKFECEEEDWRGVSERAPNKAPVGAHLLGDLRQRTVPGASLPCGTRPRFLAQTKLFQETADALWPKSS